MICLSQYIQEDFKISKHTVNEIDKQAHDDLLKHIDYKKPNEYKFLYIKKLKQESKHQVYLNVTTARWINTRYGSGWSIEYYVLDEKNNDIGENLFNDIRLVHERKMQLSDFIRKWYVEQDDDKFRYKIIHNETSMSFDLYVDYNLG